MAVDVASSRIYASFDDWDASASGFLNSYDASALLTALEIPTPAQLWRQTHFGTTANTGNAADSADPDGDGLANLLEYALGTLPTAANASPVAVSSAGGYLQLTVTKNAAATDVTFAAESSGDLTTWSEAATVVLTNDASTFTARDAVTLGPPRFLRLKVTRP